ncbi:MAG: YHS domain-containing (seleno)protein [Acidobacteriota bacterium]|nr:YHS domain-containing (seleno)protein [Acidobacteriota bacterium]
MIRKTQPLVLLLALLLTAVSVTGTATATEAINTSVGLTAAGGPLAIHGYDPVAYFTDGQARRGRADLSTVWNGAAYRFSSETNLQAFRKAPAKYAPQFGGFCAYGVAVGKKFDGDPELFRIVDGKLYFNLNPEIVKVWEKDLEKNITKGDQQWRVIRNKPAEDL